MGWVFFAIGAAVVLTVAFVTLGWVVGRLEHERAPAVYELSEALDWIVDRLPGEVTAHLSYAEVRRVLLWHLDWFAEVGVSSPHGEELAGAGVLDEGSVAADSTAVDAIVARAVDEARAGKAEIEAIDVVCVLDLQMQYLAHIGALGTPAE